MNSKVKLHFDHAGKGPLLLLVHGFPLDCRLWKAQVSALSDIAHVVAVDLRGHGRSKDAEPRDYSLDLLAQDLSDLLDDLGEDTAHLGGLSMGGYVLFAFWRRFRHRVRSLALVNTKAEADTQEAATARAMTAQLVREKGMAPLIETLLPKLVAPDARPDVMQSAREMFEQTDPEVAALATLAMRRRPDSTELLSSIDVPAVVIHGEQDQTAPIEGARKMAQSISGARFIPVANAGHLSPIENPEAVNAALRDFLTLQRLSHH